MTRDVKPSRSYESPRRAEQARATRRAVLDAARDLFVGQGYGATSVAAIAERARVSPETVYGAFGNKRSLLSRLLDESITGDDADVPLLEREWVQAMRAEPDRRRRLRTLAHEGRKILERRAAIDAVLAGAAASDRKMAELLASTRGQRRAGQRVLIGMVAGPGRLRRGMDLDGAADIAYALGSPETWKALVVERGWTPERFERWYEDALARLLFS